MANILIIDHHDSFVYNLVRYVQLLKHDTRVVQHDDMDSDAIITHPPCAILLSPGPCTPSQAPHTLALVRALSPTVPILGICLGHQIIGQAFGAKIVRAQCPLHGHSAPIFHDQRGIFATLPQPLLMARYHSLVIDPKSLTHTPLQVTAWSEAQEVMAIQHGTLPIIGLQSHPESICSPQGMQLLARCLSHILSY